MVILPRYAVSKIVEIIGKNTSKSLNRKFAFLKRYIGTEKLYKGRLFCFCSEIKRRSDPNVTRVTRKERN